MIDLASGNKNYDIATETKQDEILSKLESGGSSGGSTSLAGNALRAVFSETAESTLTSFKTLFSVTGKGKLCYASLVGGSINSGKLSLRITLDNKVICYLTGYTSSSKFTYGVNLLCLNNKHLYGSDFYSHEASAMIYSTIPAGERPYVYSVAPIGDINKMFTFSSSEQTVSGKNILLAEEYTGVICGLLHMNDDIPFTQNLKIECKAPNNGSNVQFLVGYTLDE